MMVLRDSQIGHSPVPQRGDNGKLAIVVMKRFDPIDLPH